jgi:hypothetical protein
MVAQKKMALRQRVFMRLSCALFGHDLQSSEREVITAFSGVLKIPQLRVNIAPFTLVTASFGTPKIVCPLSLGALRSDVNFSSHHQRLRLHFCRLTGAVEMTNPQRLWQ